MSDAAAGCWRWSLAALVLPKWWASTSSPPQWRLLSANARRNGLEATTSFSVTPAGDVDLGVFDLVVANITADVLMALAPDIAARVAPGGRLALGGISAAQTSTVAAAYRPHGIELANSIRLDDWVSLAGRRIANGPA